MILENNSGKQYLDSIRDGSFKMGFRNRLRFRQPFKIQARNF